jgi:hypothetical protein
MIRFAMPVFGAFYPKVVVGTACQLAIAIARFQDALCQCYAGWYAMLFHLLAGYFFVGGYVFFCRYFVACCFLLLVQLAVARRK